MLRKIIFTSREPAKAAPPSIHRTPVTQSRAGLSTHSSPAANPWALLNHAQPPQALQIPLQSVHLSQKSIMVIDDSATVRKILETCLRQEHFQVNSFHDGVEAMRWLITPQAHIPDLVWLDIGLPKLNGYEVARRLKSKPQFKNTVIVMLSGQDGVINCWKGRQVGVKASMTKPITREEIVSVTRSLLSLTPSEQEAALPSRVALA